MVLFSPFGERELAKPVEYVSLARLTLSLVSCTWSSGSSCKSCTECPGLQKCSATPDVSMRLFLMSHMVWVGGFCVVRLKKDPEFRLNRSMCGEF